MSPPPPTPRRVHRMSRPADPASSTGPRTSDTSPKTKQPLDKRWIAALIVGLAILLLLIMLCVAAGIGLAVASGMFSSGKGYESSSSGEDTLGQEATASAADSQQNPGGRKSDNDSDTDPDISPSDDSTDAPASKSGDSPDSASGSSSGGSSSGNGKVYVIPGGQFFGLETDGQSFVYVVDCSGSMDGQPFRRAQEEIIRSVSSLSSSQSFFVVFFSDGEFPMYHPSVTDSLTPATPANIERVTNWVQGVKASGNTDPTAALRRALQLAPDAVYLLTDGELEGDVMSIVANSNPSAVRINTVCFMNRSGEALLRQISGTTGGVHLFVP